MKRLLTVNPIAIYRRIVRLRVIAMITLKHKLILICGVRKEGLKG